ncbi:histamine H3 receptor isoform X4 [Nycticebus coucang]|uniref:histamine H3 receptor isoform X4 n=1 Tax=Nycticebus coucang TaxID=9470 RepID=UPI00234CEC6A|nr:histamine H3 receptor isoform X4 [Nycticebus coucang]
MKREGRGKASYPEHGRGRLPYTPTPGSHRHPDSQQGSGWGHQGRGHGEAKQARDRLLSVRAGRPQARPQTRTCRAGLAARRCAHRGWAPAARRARGAVRGAAGAGRGGSGAGWGRGEGGSQWRGRSPGAGGGGLGAGRTRLRAALGVHGGASRGSGSGCAPAPLQLRLPRRWPPWTRNPARRPRHRPPGSGPGSADHAPGAVRGTTPGREPAKTRLPGRSSSRLPGSRTAPGPASRRRVNLRGHGARAARRAAERVGGADRRGGGGGRGARLLRRLDRGAGCAHGAAHRGHGAGQRVGHACLRGRLEPPHPEQLLPAQPRHLRLPRGCLLHPSVCALRADRPLDLWPGPLQAVAGGGLPAVHFLCVQHSAHQLRPLPVGHPSRLLPCPAGRHAAGSTEDADGVGAGLPAVWTSHLELGVPVWGQLHP